MGGSLKVCREEAEREIYICTEDRWGGSMGIEYIGEVDMGEVIVISLRKRWMRKGKAEYM